MPRKQPKARGSGPHRGKGKQHRYDKNRDDRPESAIDTPEDVEGREEEEGEDKEDGKSSTALFEIPEF